MTVCASLSDFCISLYLSSALSALEDPDGAKDLADTFKELQQTPDYNTAMMNLKSGLVDAVAIDIGVAQYYLSQQG